ncbi:MAG: hypothetical protein ACYCYO_16785 [Bacilli bacterium]
MFRIKREDTDLRGNPLHKEVAYGITDLTEKETDAALIGSWVRGHWGIETRLHYVRDMTYDEDRSQVRTGNGSHRQWSAQYGDLAKRGARPLAAHEGTHYLKCGRAFGLPCTIVPMSSCSPHNHSHT